jgi:hypothetical protein
MLILYFLRPITVNSVSAAGAKKMFMLTSATRENTERPKSEKWQNWRTGRARVPHPATDALRYRRPPLGVGHSG